MEWYFATFLAGMFMGLIGSALVVLVMVGSNIRKWQDGRWRH